MHVRAIGETTGARVVAVANHRLATAEAFAARHGIERATTDWQTLVTAPEIDAVVVGTPNALHAPQALAALAAGKHVLVEKPMALTVAEGEAMTSAADRADRVLAVGHMWRFRDEVRALRSRIAAGELGRVVRTHGYGVHAAFGPAGWFCDPALAGGGALIDMGVHAIDTARFLLGDPEPARVCASIGTAFGGYAVDDDGLLLIDWEGGVRSIIECGWWQPRIGGLEADTEVTGTGGYARIWPAVPMPAGYEHCDLPMFSAQMADLVRRASDRRAAAASGLDTAAAGLVALRVIEQAYASARAVG